MDVTVSIIIPAFNAEKHIAQSIYSALTQTEQNIEIIVVDDGSTDDTISKIRHLSDKRIKLLCNKVNRGGNYSRNRALLESRGEWIALLDADDWFGSPVRLRRMLDVAYAENADMVADDIYLIKNGAEQP